MTSGDASQESSSGEGMSPVILIRKSHYDDRTVGTCSLCLQDVRPHARSCRHCGGKFTGYHPMEGVDVELRNTLARVPFPQHHFPEGYEVPRYKEVSLN